MAFTAVGALIAGEAVTATLVLSAVAEVGMAMTVVGGVVGSKDLMKIGAAMSLVGGVGGMIAGATSGAAGAAGAAGEAAAGSAMDAAAAEALTAGASDAAINATTDGLLADISGQAASSALPATQMAGLEAPAINNPSAFTAPQTPSQTLQSDLNVTPDSTATVTPNETAGQGAKDVMTPADANANAKDVLLQNKAVSSPMNAPESSGNFFSRMGKFANDNKTLFSAGLQLAGGALKGANDTKMWNEKMAFQREQAARANSVGNFAPRAGIIAGARA